jgi:hypothetical protein
LDAAFDSVMSGMDAVIHGRGQPYGVLGAHMARKRRFNSHEAHFLQSIADVLAEAIMRRQLEEELLPIPPGVKHSGGMGLRIMRYRAEMIGGTLRIAPTAEGKTAVICSFKAVA